MILQFKSGTSLLSLFVVSCSAAIVLAQSPEYGVDISYPMHYPKVSTNYDYLPSNNRSSSNVDVESIPEEYRGMPIQPLGDRQSLHDHYMQGCRDKYGERAHLCDTNEAVRVQMTLRQPQSMKNYTKMGFTKIRAPELVFSLIKDFWEKNRERQTEERWATGNIYTNHWEHPSHFINVGDPEFEGGGKTLKKHIWDAARSTIEEWTGQKLVECSLYGIRIYREGAVLASHVDRLPLVASAIINVDQDVDEPWPLEVIGHDGKAYNVTMEPGDLVLYESHSIIHGRPFKLKGRFMANVFIHFEPIGPADGQVEYNGDLPPYIIPGSPEEPYWRKANPTGHRLHSGKKFENGSTHAHHLAQLGDYEGLKALLDKDASFVKVRDKNGWAPLHEAIRRGDVEMTTLLLERGADPNGRVGMDGKGYTPMNLVDEYVKDRRSKTYRDLKYFLTRYGGGLRRHRPQRNDEL